MVSQQNRNFSGCAHNPVESLGRSSPNLPAVAPYETDIPAHRKRDDRPCHRHAFSHDRINGVRNHRVLRCYKSDGFASVIWRNYAGSHLIRGQIVKKDALAANPA